jgi:hypothetical protein
MRFQRAILAALPLMLAPSAGAEIYRCTQPGAAVAYQQQPCEAGAQGVVMPIAASFLDHREARDRLAAREAAADERRMRRLEIEAAERIARDHRVARELELEAERERARAREAAVPVYVLGPPLKWRDTRAASGTPRSRPRR